MTTSVEARRYRPEVCVWELTTACNLRCGHCGSKAGLPRPDELTTAECLDVVRALAELGGRIVTLSGGEPTMRDDWEEIAAAIRDHGMIANMVTNGVAMDAALAARMKAVGLANVAVSIDGPADVHEALRGHNTFAKSCAAVRLLDAAGVSTVIMTTITRANLHRLAETYQVAVDLGVARWRTQLGKPMGNLDKSETISPKDLLMVLPELYRLDQTGDVSVGIGDSLGYYGPYDALLRATNWDGSPQCWGGCQAGMRAIGIESNGGIKGCLSIQASRGPDDEFIEGNLRARSLPEIWRDPSAFAYNRHFDAATLTGFCKRCEHRLRCRGGARCVAAAACGRISEDPYCYHRVSTLAQRRPVARLRRQVATAASVVSLALAGGCSLYTSDKSAADASPQGGACEEVCCECDYGVLPPEIIAECCTPEPIDCEPVCCECEYGVLPPAVEAACCTPEPIDCEPVCCECDYGVLPPDVVEECCTPEPIDCEAVCCECEYGILPPEVEEACCTPEPIDCEAVCCECDYGVLPPEVIAECCSE